MSPLITVSPLKLIVSKKVMSVLLSSITRNSAKDDDYDDDDDDDDKKEKDSRIWIPTLIKTNMINDVLSLYDIDEEIKYRFLLLLYSSDVTRLHFSFMNESVYEKLTVFLSERCDSNLESLSLMGVWLKSDNLDRFINSSLIKMINLRRLIMPQIATDRVLEVIGRISERLTYLDIAGSSSISNKGLESLYQSSKLCRTLRYLNFGPSDSISVESVSELIVRLRNLISLGSYPLTGSAVVLAVTNQSKFVPKLRYIHDGGTDKHRFRLLASTCPDLQGCFWSDPFEMGREFLSDLDLYSSLEKLKVSKGNADSIVNGLERDIGRNLTDIELINTKGWLDLSVIAKRCPNLVHLDIFYSRGVSVENRVDFTFPKLRQFTIYCTEIPRNCSRLLLRSCPSAEKLTLCQCDGLTDDEFYSVIEENPFLRLRELVLLQASFLTIQTARCAMTCLPQMTFLGRLDTWNVTWMEVEELRYEIKEYNLDLRLWENFSTQSIEDHFGLELAAEGAEFL